MNISLRTFIIEELFRQWTRACPQYYTPNLGAMPIEIWKWFKVWLAKFCIHICP